jgi:adenylate cyclase
MAHNNIVAPSSFNIRCRAIESLIDTLKLQALDKWLVAGAPPQTRFTDTTAELGRRMNATGLPVQMLGLYVLNINPMVLGSLYWWTPRGGTKEVHVSHEYMAGPKWQGTIAQVCLTERRFIHHRIGCGDALDLHPSTMGIAQRGYVDYLACPLIAMHGPVNAFAVATKQLGGFSTEETNAIRRLQAPLARVVESQSLYSNTVSILSTYVGRNSGEMVLHGRIRRGDLENIAAVILFADMSGFARLSNVRSPAESIAVLNNFFEAFDTAIRTNGGEILKFVGDGLLAIFPTPDDITAQEVAAAAALSAVRDAKVALSAAADDNAILFRAALHIGDVHYGNIGSASRLDFTVVGPAVNLAARMLQVASERQLETVCSEEFAALLNGQARAIGEVNFKGFSGGTRIYSF